MRATNATPTLAFGKKLGDCRPDKWDEGMRGSARTLRDLREPLPTRMAVRGSAKSPAMRHHTARDKLAARAA